MAEAILNFENSAKRVLGFVHFLRGENFSVGVSESQSIAQALIVAGEPDRTVSCALLRTLCCRGEDEWFRFERLFEHYWFPRSLNERLSADPISRALDIGGGIVGLGAGVDNPAAYDGEKSSGGGAAKQTTITKSDFRFLGDKRAMRKVELLAEQLARRLTDSKSRKSKINLRNGQLAFRPTLRRSVRYLGEPLVPVYSRPQQEPPNIVILHDVSHSMTFNNPLLVRFTRGLVQRFRSVEAFVFHTRLFRVTTTFREASLQRMRDQLEANNHLWLGGTCIADSLGEFLQDHSRGVLLPKSRVIIISDGCDANAPQQLAKKLVEIRKRCKELIWLNPMLERKGVDPESVEMQNLRQHVDKLLPAHSLFALKQLVDHLSR